MKCRKNVRNLTSNEKKRYVDAFTALKAQDSVIHPGAQSRYDDFVETHRNAMTAAVNWAHGDSVFFPWHRELLYQFEKLLQSIDPSVTIPYWDWTRHQNSASAGFPFQHNFIGVDGDNGDSGRVKRDPVAPAVDATHPYIYPFDPQTWTVPVEDGDGLTFFQRQFGQRGDAPNLPKNDNLVVGVNSTFRQAIGSADYLNLRSRSEDIHNLVHRWVGGNMLRMTSPNDPVFFMHHAQIDRMWSIWQKKVALGTNFYVQSSSAPGHKLNDAMIFNDVNPAPFVAGTTIAQVIDGHTMHGTGVWYESDIPTLSNETGATLNFANIPEGLTSFKAVKFKVKGCRPVHLRITGAPTGHFGLTPMGTEFVAKPDETADFFYAYAWVRLTAVAGSIAPSAVDIHAYILDEEGYYAATEGGEVALGDFHVALTATTVARANNSVAIVLDRSGSMSDPAGGLSTKRDLLSNAIQVFRDLMLSDDEVAVVTFDDVVETPVAMEQVSVAPIFSTIDIAPRGSTWIGGGIQQGAAQLAAATHTNRSMIVLTDGNENVHPYIGELAAGIMTNRTYAIGFGLPGDVSDAALQQITSNTHGDLIITGAVTTDEQRFALTKYFVQVLAGVTRMDVILDPQGSLFVGEVQIIPFQITEADVYADIITLCPIPKLIQFYLETPDGTIVKPSDAATEPNIKYIMGQQVVYYRVALPALATDAAGSHSGTWKAILGIRKGDDFGRLAASKSVSNILQTQSISGSLPYNFIVHTYSNLTFRSRLHQSSLKPGAMVTLFASLNEYDVPLPTDAAVWAEVTSPDNGRFDLKLVKIDTGTYSASFNASMAGIYSSRVRAEGLTSKGSLFTREHTLTAGVYFGNYDPVPPPRRGEDLCHLIECISSGKVLNPALIDRLSKLGVDIRQLEHCLAKACRRDSAERVPGILHKAFEAARKKRLLSQPRIEIKKAPTSLVLKLAVRPIAKAGSKNQPDTMFMPMEVAQDPKPKTNVRKSGKRRSRK